MAQVLRHLPQVRDTSVVVDATTRDDAAVIRIAPDRVLIATVDFFTPIVDDAGTWGAIAAANALSDVYAMGGKPLFALSLVGWPRERLPFDLLGEAMAGAARVLEQAACPTVGGHSVDDPEPKLGFAVIGEAHPDRLLTNAGGRVGDVLVLTKPLGTGILTTALKRDLLEASDLDSAVRSMTALNDAAARVALDHGVRTATDVTGFGLLGHLTNILEASRVGAEIYVDTLPIFPGALELAGRGIVPGGTQRNLEVVQAEWSPEVTPAERLLCADAQTSGGLLLAVPAGRAADLVTALVAAGTQTASVVGRLTEGGLRVLKRQE